MALEDPGGTLSPGERARLVEAFAAAVRRQEPRESPWRRARAPGPETPAHFRDANVRSIPGQVGMAVRPTLLPIPPALLFQLVLLAAALLVALGWRRWYELARRVPRADLAWIAGCTAIGLGLRLWGGVRVPGHVNGHGYDLLRHLLFAPIPGHDFHGSGAFALHRLALAVLPRHELSVVAVQCACSVLTIPAFWAAARLWLRSDVAARFSAAAAAVLPAFVFYALTEERFVPGVLLMLLAAVALGAAVRSRAAVDLGAAALLAAAACQFQPVLYLAPVALGLLLLADRDGRSLGRHAPAWLALALLAALVADGAVQHLRGLAGAHGPAGMVPDLLAHWTAALHRRINAFLDPALTPPLLPILAVAALVGTVRYAERRAVVLALGLAALAFTVPALVPGRLNTARLQLGAQPFYLLLAGAGVAAIARAAGRWPRAARLVGPLAAAGLVAAVVAWPGPIGRTYTPQRERRFLAASLPDLPDGCVVIWPELLGEVKIPLPVHLSMQARRALTWEGLATTDVVPTRPATCLYYYRPTACFDVELDPVDPRGGELRADCARIERALDLAPARLVTVPAAPDSTQRYTRARLTIGFFRVRGVRPPGPGRGP